MILMNCTIFGQRDCVIKIRIKENLIKLFFLIYIHIFETEEIGIKYIALDMILYVIEIKVWIQE